MKTRKILHTGLEVSEIGLGCEHLENKDQALVDEVLGAALDGGINILDVFMPQPEVRTQIGNFIHRSPGKFHLQGHMGVIIENGQYKRTRNVAKSDEFVCDFLRRLQIETLDIGMLHFVDDLEDWHTIENEGLLEYALQLKQKGIIRALGMSSHAPHTALAAVQSGYLDVLMFSINPSFDLLSGQIKLDDMFVRKTFDEGASNGLNPVRQQLYETCAQQGVAITVMKTLAAGQLLNAETSALGAALSVAQCEHYALTRPAVVSVLVGCASGEQVREALAYETLSEQEKDYTAVLSSSQRYAASGNCMYCNHCLPCPAEIDIAAVHKYYDLAKNLAEIPATIREHYLALHSHASDCIACGACEERCPFGVKVIENMHKAEVLFGV